MKNPKIKLLFAALYIILTMALMRVISRILPDIPNDFVDDLVSELILTVFSVTGVVLFRKTALLKPTLKGFGTGIKAGLLLIVLNLIMVADYLTREDASITAAGWEIALFVIQMLLIGVAEEVMFRVLLQSAALEVTGEDSVSAARKGILLGAVAFGLVHLGNILAGINAGSVVNQAIMAIPMGAVLGAIYFRGNLLSAILVHAVIDGCAFISNGVLSGGSAGDAIEAVGSRGIIKSVAGVAFFTALFLSLTSRASMEKTIAARKAAK